MSGGAIVAAAFVAIFVSVTSFWGERPGWRRIVTVNLIGGLSALAAWAVLTPFVDPSAGAHVALAILWSALVAGCFGQGRRRARAPVRT